MERRRYLTELVKKIQRKTDKELLLHLGNFAYDHKNHEVLLELRVLDLLISLLVSNDLKIIEFSLGCICNLSSNHVFHDKIPVEAITLLWEKVSVPAQRSIAAILYYTNYQGVNLPSEDKVVHNIRSCL